MTHLLAAGLVVWVGLCILGIVNKVGPWMDDAW